ncbi:hypothetical protein DPMN_008595 [Dreissena polymorpha]|uniref:Uncharacterized protein n=1 Tax=Dreissena polymorpha TaxID=45954 RepID=A0A9D4RZU1_DREPO|nr:hypothetical protein DPMN_008595 [Dreissena polymorpha]
MVLNRGKVAIEPHLVVKVSLRAKDGADILPHVMEALSLDNSGCENVRRKLQNSMDMI